MDYGSRNNAYEVFEDMTKFRNLIIQLIAITAVSILVTAQNPPKVIAWQAPTAISNPPTDCLAANETYLGTFMQGILPNISGIGVSVVWGCIDNCSTTGPCATPGQTGWQESFNWDYLDRDLRAYINYTNGVFSNKKIVLIVQPVNDTSPNHVSSNLSAFSNTPYYVFTAAYATNNSWPVQDVTVCGDWAGTNMSGSPVSGNFINPNDVGIWNQNNCDVLNPTDLHCSCPTNCNFSDFSGMPVMYENSIMKSYQNFLLALFTHYSPQGNGFDIAPYILYARIGLTHGGENYAYCAAIGTLQLQCKGNPTPCNMGDANSTWPGPKGQFNAEPWQGNSAFSDAGYLTQWKYNNDGAGYITAMMQFLNENATFPVTIASSYGPPGQINQLYANLEAQLAEEYNVGFGNQVENIYDTVLAGAGMAAHDNWVANFKNYPYAPVHHLQLAATNTVGYAINDITYSAGTATVYCSGSGCNNFCPPNGAGVIYIQGNSSPALNGVFQTLSSCNTANQVQFTPTQVPSCGTSPCNSGTMWGASYLPITLPFAAQQNATSAEIWECDLDFTYSVMTTTGCSNSLSADPDFMNAIANTLLGIPAWTSVHTDDFYNALQF